MTVYLTADQVATRLQVTRRTVYNMRRARRLPLPVMVGHQLRWVESEIDEYLAKRRANY